MSKPNLAVSTNPRPRRRAAALALLLGLAPACGSGDGDGDDSGDSTGDDAGGSESGGDTGEEQSPILIGSFQVGLVAPVPANGDTPATPGKSTLFGKIYDGPTPAQIVWEPGTKDGDCQLLTPRVPFCATPCGGSAVCVEDDTCVAYPAAGSAGTVTVTGVETGAGEREFTMDPIANNYQPSGGVSLAYPAFAEGDEITLAASGDHFEAFTLRARGIAQLALTNKTISLKDGAPVDLTWTAPAQAGASTVHVKLDISHHGGTKGMITCDTADAGALTISAPLVKQLLDLGVAGFPTIIVTRSSVGSATIAEGRIDLVVSSDVEHVVEIDGLASCTADVDCSDGKTCQSDLTCQ